MPKPPTNRFQPGQSGNPKGREPMYNLTLGDILRKKANTLRNKTKLAQTLIDLATKGESESTRLAAAKLILETVDGRPATKPTPKSAADNKLTVTFEDAANRPS